MTDADTLADREALFALKAQRAANRAARIRQLHTAAETWRQQQESLTTLARLRPAGTSATTRSPLPDHAHPRP
jgi:hypothetical protein